MSASLRYFTNWIHALLLESERLFFFRSLAQNKSVLYDTTSGSSVPRVCNCVKLVICVHEYHYSYQYETKLMPEKRSSGANVGGNHCVAREMCVQGRVKASSYSNPIPSPSPTCITLTSCCLEVRVNSYSTSLHLLTPTPTRPAPTPTRQPHSSN